MKEKEEQGNNSQQGQQSNQEQQQDPNQPQQNNEEEQNENQQTQGEGNEEQNQEEDGGEAEEEQLVEENGEEDGNIIEDIKREDMLQTEEQQPINQSIDTVLNEEEERIKKEQFKKGIITFRVDEMNTKDPDLRELNEKVASLQLKDDKVLSKVKNLEKLSEDLNLLTNYLRNGMIDASKIQSLHKTKKRKEFNPVEINNDISQSCFECKKPRNPIPTFFFNFFF